MTVCEYMMSDIEQEYIDYSIVLQDEEGNILFYGDKYDLITSDEYGDLLVLKVEEDKEGKTLIICAL